MDDQDWKSSFWKLWDREELNKKMNSWRSVTEIFHLYFKTKNGLTRSSFFFSLFLTVVFVWRNPFYADSPNWLDGSVQFLMLVVTVKQGKHGQYWLNSLFLFSPFSRWTDCCSPLLRYDEKIHLCWKVCVKWSNTFHILNENMNFVCFSFSICHSGVAFI